MLIDLNMQMKPLPNIPEAVIPGTPFGIEVLKAVFALFGVFSLIGSIPGLHSVHTEHFRFVANQGLFNHLLSLGYAVLFGIGLYGVHRRTRLAWKLGWIYLGIFYISSVVSAITASKSTMPATGQWILLSAIVAMFAAVAVYWGNWWKKQEPYFKA